MVDLNIELPKGFLEEEVWIYCYTKDERSLGSGIGFAERIQTCLQ